MAVTRTVVKTIVAKNGKAYTVYKNVDNVTNKTTFDLTSPSANGINKTPLSFVPANIQVAATLPHVIASTPVSLEPTFFVMETLPAETVAHMFRCGGQAAEVAVKAV